MAEWWLGPTISDQCGQNPESALLHWWWEGMNVETVKFYKDCPGYTTIPGVGCWYKSPLCPILIQTHADIISMELPKTENSNQYVIAIVSQDFFIKWSLMLQTLTNIP